MVEILHFAQDDNHRGLARARELRNANTPRWDAGSPSQWKSIAATRAPAEFPRDVPCAARYRKCRSTARQKRSSRRRETPAADVPVALRASAGIPHRWHKWDYRRFARE